MCADTTRRFESILSPHAHEVGVAQQVDALHDLALDQVFARVDEGAPRAASAFRVLLGSVAEVEYRQAVFRALEHEGVRSAVRAFLEGMSRCDQRDHAAAQARSPYAGELWHLSAVTEYVGTVEAFHSDLVGSLPELETRSDGWDRLCRHVDEYRSSPVFGSLESDAIALQDQLAALRYNALIRGAKVALAPTDGEADLSKAVLSTFERFRQGEVADHRTEFRAAGLDHVQAWMLERVAKVHPKPFAHLVRFARETQEYRDRMLVRFADEVRFYLAYLDFLAPLRRAGLPVSYPAVSPDQKKLAVSDAWDLALAAQMVENNQSVVTNDATLTGKERVLVISGPNQGGKTTTARMFGQMHHLAAIGCPVPGRQAEIFLCDKVLTVFEREEQLDSLEGRLGAEVKRLYEMFNEATERSVIVINEAFASTALHDARILTRDVLERISERDALAVCVTFIDDLSRLNDKTVSMTSMVDPADPAVRTFRVERRVADGRAYARALAEKHGLTLDRIRARIETPSPSVAHREGSS